MYKKTYSLSGSGYYVNFKKGDFFRFSHSGPGFRGPMTNLVGHWIMVFVARLYGKDPYLPRVHKKFIQS